MANKNYGPDILMSYPHNDGLLTFFINFARLKVEMNVGHISEMLDKCENTKKNWVPKSGTQKILKIEKNGVYLEIFKIISG